MLTLTRRQDGTGRERRVTSFIAETNHCLNNLLAEEFSLQKIHAVGIRDDIHQQKLTLDTIDEKLSANRAIASSQSWALIDVKRHLEK
jgi:hypothetical protein